MWGERGDEPVEVNVVVAGQVIRPSGSVYCPWQISGGIALGKREKASPYDRSARPTAPRGRARHREHGACNCARIVQRQPEQNTIQPSLAPGEDRHTIDRGSIQIAWRYRSSPDWAPRTRSMPLIATSPHLQPRMCAWEDRRRPVDAIECNYGLHDEYKSGSW